VDRAEANAGPVARSIENGTGGAVTGNPGGTASAAPVATATSDAPRGALPSAAERTEQLAAKVADLIVQSGTIPNMMAVATLKKIALKPSWQTGEFWVLVAIVIGGNVLALQGAVNGELAYLVNAGAGIAYVALRQNFKDKGHQAIEDLLTVLPTPAGGLTTESAKIAKGPEVAA
jgi:hypothetical protein